MKKKKNKSLYIHIPFCARKCPYCAFYSVAACSGEIIDCYIDALARELSRVARGSQFDTLYIGGGTPSVLSPAQWRRLMGAVDASVSLAPGAEITVEANPGSLTSELIMLWRDWRVTRASVGVQSTDDEELRFLGRVHSAREAFDAVAACVAAGFSVSADLIFGLQGQTLRGWARTIDDVLHMRVDHISIYQLSIEPGTPFANHEPDNLTDGYALYRYAQWRLPRAGYGQYEVASFARPGRESRHNTRYWTGGDYVGTGAGAWGYEDGTRYQNLQDVEAYIAAMDRGDSPRSFSETLDADARAREAAILLLRTKQGIVREVFEREHGEKNLAAIENKLEQFSDNLIETDQTGIRLTPAGFRVANAIWREIV